MGWCEFCKFSVYVLSTYEQLRKFLLNMIWGTIIEKKIRFVSGKISSESFLVPRLKRSKNLDHKQRNYPTETLLLFTRLQAFSYGRGKGGGNHGVNEAGTWVSKMTGAFRRVVKSFRRLCSTLQKETKHQKVGTTFEVAETGSEIAKFSYQPPSPRALWCQAVVLLLPYERFKHETEFVKNFMLYSMHAACVSVW